MGVKKFLEKQDAGFISLHDLLLKMTKDGDGCTLKEAATALSQLLSTTDSRTRPSWFIKNNLSGVMRTSENLNSSPMQQLYYVAKNGFFKCNEFDDDIPF